MCGASHANRPATALAASCQTVVNLYESGWRVTKESCSVLADRLKEVLAGADSWTPIVVLELMDNTSYFSSLAEGKILACEKGKDGIYHVSGELIVAPKELTNQTLRSILQVVTAAREHKTLLLTPLPPYLLTACCEREHHCTNFGDKNYKVGQLEALTQQWKATK